MRFTLSVISILMLVSCAKEFTNPYDPVTPPDSWMPSELDIEQIDRNSVRLHWEQDEQHIDGYMVIRDVSGKIDEISVSFDSVPYTDFQVLDENLDTCLEVIYNVMARAGTNTSSPLGSGVLVFPLTTVASAGYDQTFTDNTIQTTLSANNAGVGETGQWFVVSGDGGSFSDVSSPTATFTGLPCTSYVLRWTIFGSCGSVSSDEVVIQFQRQTTQANAGPDIAGTQLGYTLSANTPGPGETGQWSIVSGTGGTLSNTSSQNTTFSGLVGTTYVLRWRISGLCSSTTDLVNVTITPSIGDTFQGGTVFYLDGNGHGLIAAPADWTTVKSWGCNGTIIGSTESSVGGGRSNTISIVDNCSEAGTAARVCNDLSSGGYDDWFLPSKDELQLMYDNLHSQGLGGFLSTNYWSSTEYNALTAWRFNFSHGNAYNVGSYKYNPYYVRAIRAF